MHDNTNVPLMSPSDPDLHNALYSDYYGGCVGKGGVAIQPCGWIRTLPLCTGAIGDQAYLSKTETFEKQKIFTEIDETSDEPATNVMDKGYRSTLEAQKQGQRCLQPDFAESDRRFKSDQTLHSAAVAVVRSGNERAVKMVKHSWFVKRGASLYQLDYATIDDIWMGWGFRVNFMYSPVH